MVSRPKADVSLCRRSQGGEEGGGRRGEEEEKADGEGESLGVHLKAQEVDQDNAGERHVSWSLGVGGGVPGEGDVGGDGEAEDEAEQEEHLVGGDEGEEEDTDGGTDEGAGHHEQGVHPGEVRQPARHYPGQ